MRREIKNVTVGYDHIFFLPRNDFYLQSLSIPRQILLDKATEALTAADMDSFVDLALGEHLGNGSTSMTYGLYCIPRTNQFPDFAMRIQPRAAHSPGYRNHEPALLIRDTVSDLGISTPRIYATDADVDPPPNFTFSIEDYIHGQNGYYFIPSNLDRKDEIAKEVGNMLAKIHSVKIPKGFGFFDSDAANDGQLIGIQRNLYGSLTADLIQQLQSINHLLFSDQSLGLANFFATDPLIDKISQDQTVLLHGEYGPHNWIMRNDPTDNKIKICIIDFGEAQAGPVLQDFANLSVYLHRQDLNDLLPIIIQAYSDSGGTLPDDFEKKLGVLRLRMAIKLLSIQTRYEQAFPNSVPESVRDAIHEIIISESEKLQISGFESF